MPTSLNNSFCPAPNTKPSEQPMAQQLLYFWKRLTHIPRGLESNKAYICGSVWGPSTSTSSTMPAFRAAEISRSSTGITCSKGASSRFNP